MKVLHFADVHLHNGRLDEEITKCCLYILSLAREETPDLIIISGDIFDLYRDNCGLRLGSNATLFAADFVRCLAEIAPVIITTGTLSHDPPHAVDIFTRLQTVFPVHTATKLEQIGLCKGEFITVHPDTVKAYEKDLQIVVSCVPSVTKATIIAELGLSQIDESNRATEEIVRDVFQAWGITNSKAKNMHIPTLLAGHCTVRGSVTSTGQKMVGKELEFGTNDLKLTNCDIFCLGHIHKAQKINGTIFYSGSITRLDHGETEEKGVFFHEFEYGKPVISRFVKTPARVMKSVSVAEGEIPGASLLDTIEEGDAVRIRYSIREDELSKIDEQALIRAALKKGAASVTFDKEIIAVNRVRSEGISTLSSLEDKLAAWGEMTGQTVGTSLKEKLSVLTSMDPDKIVGLYSTEKEKSVYETDRLVA